MCVCLGVAWGSLGSHRGQLFSFRLLLLGQGLLHKPLHPQLCRVEMGEGEGPQSGPQ